MGAMRRGRVIQPEFQRKVYKVLRSLNSEAVLTINTELKFSPRIRRAIQAVSVSHVSAVPSRLLFPIYTQKLGTSGCSYIYPVSGGRHGVTFGVVCHSGLNGSSSSPFDRIVF